MMSDIMLHVIKLCVIMLNVVKLSVIMVHVVKLSVIMLNVIKLRINMLNVVKLNVVMLSVNMLNVVVILGSSLPTLLVPKQSSFCADIFQRLLWQQHLANLHQNMVFSAKAVTLNMLQNFCRTVGKTEEHLLRHLLYTGIFASCALLFERLEPEAVFLVVCDLSMNEL
jgi:hypothetical protein